MFKKQSKRESAIRTYVKIKEEKQRHRKNRKSPVRSQMESKTEASDHSLSPYELSGSQDVTSRKFSSVSD